jgi:hypothetical protein
MRGNSDYFLVSTNFVLSVYPNLCYFTVLRAAASSSNTIVGVLSTAGRGLGLGNSGTNLQQRYYTNVQNVVSITAETWGIAMLQNTIAAGTMGWNGTYTNAFASETGTDDLGGFRIGSYDSGGSPPYSGNNAHFDVAEILVYGSVVSRNERLQIEGYLARKWGLTANLPVTQPFRSLPPFARQFLPTDILGCVVWFDASDRSTFTLSGTTITQWRDKSANGDTTSGGTFNAVGTLGNGLSTVTLTTNVTTANQVNISGSAPQTYVIVGNVTSDTTNNIGIIHWQTSGGGNAFTNSMSLNVYQTSVDTGINQVGNFISITGLTATKTKLAIATHTGTLASIFESGTSGPTSTNTLNQTNGNLRFGVNAGSADLGEVMVFNRALSTNERQRLESYLAKKWNLYPNLPSTHPQRFLPPLIPLLSRPPQIAGCSLWLDASDQASVVRSGNNVTQWTDRSGNGWNATPQSTNPTYANNGVIFAASSMLNTSLSYTTLTTMTYFIVGRYSGTFKQDIIGVFTNTVGGGWQIMINEGNQLTGAYGGAGVNGGAAVTQNVTYLYTGTLVSNGSSVVYLNGTLTNTRDPTTTVGGSGTLTIGGYRDSGNPNGAELYNGVLNEIIVFTGRLANPQRQQLEGYLAWKWGLRTNLPATHIHYKSRP